MFNNRSLSVIFNNNFLDLFHICYYLFYAQSWIPCVWQNRTYNFDLCTSKPSIIVHFTLFCCFKVPWYIAIIQNIHKAEPAKVLGMHYKGHIVSWTKFLFDYEYINNVARATEIIKASIFVCFIFFVKK